MLLHIHIQGIVVVAFHFGRCFNIQIYNFTILDSGKECDSCQVRVVYCTCAATTAQAGQEQQQKSKCLKYFIVKRCQWFNDDDDSVTMAIRIEGGIQLVAVGAFSDTKSCSVKKLSASIGNQKLARASIFKLINLVWNCQ